MSRFAQSPQRVRLIAISASFLIGSLLMLTKFFAYWLTQSAAILSDALESIINVAASAFALVAVVLAAKPPDPTHPYGHGKIEYLSVGFEGALIFLAAIGIFFKAADQLLTPDVLPNLGSGLWLTVAATLINLSLGVVLVYVGKRTQSITLMADGKHVLTDVYTSGGVILGLFLVWFTDRLWIDGATAGLVGINVIFTGWKLVRHAFAGLMDASDAELLDEITKLLRQHRKSVWIDIHQLRARRAGTRIYADLHLILPRDFSLQESYQEVKEMEKIFAAHYQGQAEIHVHVDPCDDSECPVCGYDPCTMRQARTVQQRLWRRDVVTDRREENTPETP
ncbi:cation diffusion facilitator family transporter [Desulfobacca acetoxidans]|jgi:cation diffusion facilitator family transporter|nr:cation transporter [Desulfobacterales bacterium]